MPGFSPAEGQHLTWALFRMQTLGFTVAFPSILQLQACSPCRCRPCLSPVSVVSFKQGRVVLGVGGSCEDSLRPRMGKWGWREFSGLEERQQA